METVLTIVGVIAGLWVGGYEGLFRTLGHTPGLDCPRCNPRP